MKHTRKDLGKYKDFFYKDVRLSGQRSNIKIIFNFDT